MPEYRDQLDNIVALKDVPKRIISLVPSQTELLHYLGLEHEVVGITKFCVHPKSWFNSKKRIGGTKAVHIEEIRMLKPDLIIANKEENVKAQVDALSEIAPVWISNINNLDDALEMIERVGIMVNKKERAEELVAQIKTNFSKLEQAFDESTNQLLNQSNSRPRITYLIWRDPYMTVGGDTFINDIVKRCGFTNVFEYALRYPQITLEELPSLNCQYIFLSSEPFPFKEKHAEEIKRVLSNIKIIFVDGEMFSWYGSRLLLATQYFKELKEHLGERERYYV